MPVWGGERNRMTLKEQISRSVLQSVFYKQLSGFLTGS
jgi:hypothetical protein